LNLASFFAIYTRGAAPRDTFSAPSGLRVSLGEMPEVVWPSARRDELFGPHVKSLERFKPSRGFLLAISNEARGDPVSFFDQVRHVLLEAVSGLEGVGLDVLRLWPFPLGGAAEEFSEDLLADDLFSVGFQELGDSVFRAETFGLAKLGQRELVFTFCGRDLLDDAQLLCGHLADWLLEHRRVVRAGDSLHFGFDRLIFRAAEGTAGGPFRGWHPPLIQRLLPEALFPGVGLTEVRAADESGFESADNVTAVLRRAFDQRQLLEEYDLLGDSPHLSKTASVRGRVRQLARLTAVRDEPRGTKDSGWHFLGIPSDSSSDSGVVSLGDLVRRAPGLVRFLALPPGVRLEWNAHGVLHVDVSRARELEVDDEDPD
jgi:hypothetical protein